MKKGLILLCLILAFQSLPVCVVSAEDAVLQSDVSGRVDAENTDIVANTEKIMASEGYKLLEVLELITADELQKETSYTRQEFVDFAAKVAKIPKTASQPAFVDTTGDSIAHTFADMGILKVDSDKAFRPNENITHIEAAIIMVRILGYDDYIRAHGGGMSEYWRVANRLGITIGKDVNDLVDASDAVQLMFNALRVEIYETTAFEAESVSYSQTDTLLDRIYDVVWVNGIFSANEWVSVYDDVKPAGKERITVGAYTLKSENPEILKSNLIGQDVKVYIKGYDKDTMTEAILMLPDGEDDDVFTFTSADVDKTTTDSVSFYIGEKLHTITLTNPNLIYNGEADFTKSASYALSLMNVADTEITLVRNSKSNGYFLVIINAYTTAKITSVDTTKGYIYAKTLTGAGVNIPIKVAGGVSRVYIEDLSYQTETTVDYLSAGNIIQYYTSNSGKDVVIYWCSKSINGTIQSLTDKGGKRYANLGTATYLIAPKLASGKIEIGTNGSFFVDKFGRIIAVTNIDNAWSMGYVYKIGTDENPFETDDYKFLVYTSDNTLETLVCAKSYILDGQSKTTGQAFVDRIAPGGVFNERLRLFRYKLNKTGEIKHIDTAAITASTNPAEIETPEAEDTLQLVGEKETRTFRRNDKLKHTIFWPPTNNLYAVDDTPTGKETRIYPYPLNTKTDVFIVPSSNTIEAKVENFGYATMGSFTAFSDAGKYSVGIYKTDSKSEFASAVVWYRNPRWGFGVKSMSWLINDMGMQEIDSNGDVRYGIQVLTTKALSGETKTVLLDDTIKFTNVKGVQTTITPEAALAALTPGDVVQFGDSIDKTVGHIRVIFDYDADDPNSPDDDNRGQVFWGWLDETGNPLPSGTPYTYKFKTYWTKDTTTTSFIAAYGYLLDSVFQTDNQNLWNSYGSTAPMSYAFLGEINTEGSGEIASFGEWTVGFERLAAFDPSRRENKAYYSLFTDFIDYKSSPTEYYHVLLLDGGGVDLGGGAVFYKR
ncbi:MAG: S-layer homology domain-containing protein [Clostridia bacterium]|nr:S-layer homology domain-containing protein [Clostridia bacterium]